METTTLHNILSKEATNRNAIYLYEREGRWLAYGRSAYLFSQIFKVGEVVRTGAQVCIATTNSFEFLQSKTICSVKITSVADGEIKIDCATSFKGFKQWEKKQLN